MITLIISDVHLGSEVSRASELHTFLKTLTFDRLILNGDIFDDYNFKKLKKSHWKLLSYFRKTSKKKELIWVAGNHDGIAQTLSLLLGIKVYDRYFLNEGDKRILIMHGHQFDRFLADNVFVSNVADWIYRLIQTLDTKHKHFSRWIKSASKQWLRLSDKVAERAAKYAKHHNSNVIICGHTHMSGYKKFDYAEYYNTGCWTDSPAHYVVINEGSVELLSFT